jgi:NAD(P)-dependent dehydrogenase (short-subunit alcohol dehydrogenase family)
MTSPWTADDIPNQTGRTALVTGANSGIGFETAKELARKEAHVVMACRDPHRARGAAAAIRSEVPNASLELIDLDLADLASVRAFADAFRESHQRLDLLINNAGIMMTPYGTTADGFEQQFGTNHLGHFALTGLLIDSVLAAPGARVVNVSSGGHRMGSMDFDNLQYEDGGYGPARAYGRSKLANLLFTYELQRRFRRAGARAEALAAHPGSTNTDLGRHLERYRAVRIARPLTGWISQNAAMGALPTLRAATDPDAFGGQYFGPAGRMEQRGYPKVVPSNDASHDAADARRLWAVSQSLTGVSYGRLDTAIIDEQRTAADPERGSPTRRYHRRP